MELLPHIRRGKAKLGANFHPAAAELVKRADLGEKVSEQASLGANSPYVKLSSHVVQLILKVKQR